MARRLLIVAAVIAAIAICVCPPWHARFTRSTGRVIPVEMGHFPFFARPAAPPGPGFPLPSGTSCAVAIHYERLLFELVAVALVLQWAVFGTKILDRAKRCLRQRRALHDRRRGLCPACGYDVRATTGRCPECGHVGPANADPVA